jgi:hypothetical protein
MKYLKSLALVSLVALALVACTAKLPQADVDTASAAFADAKAALADQYAPDSWKAASDANDSLQANLTAKDFGKTKSLAKALTDASTKAKADAATGLETAKTDVATLDTDIVALAPVVKAEVALAIKAGKKSKVDLKPVQALLAGTDKTLAAAKTSLESGAVADAKTALTTLKTGLTDAQTALEAAGFKK